LANCSTRSRRHWVGQVALGIGAHVDQLGGGIGLQQLKRLLRRDGAGVGLVGAPRAGGGEKLIG
jgi:hypothetical protein